MEKEENVEQKPEAKVRFCRMSSNNQITVPKSVRNEFGIDNLSGDDTALIEVKFLRVVEPTEEEANKEKGKEEYPEKREDKEE